MRIYTINRGELQAFAREWEEKIKPLRIKIGFRIEGAWLVETANQFVWVMSYDGPESWDVLDQAFFDSEERRAMTPDPARNIARIEQFFMDPISQ